MLEIILCSLVTVLPDYLYRRYRQGKRIGREITLFSVWYELRMISSMTLHLALHGDDIRAWPFSSDRMSGVCAWLIGLFGFRRNTRQLVD